MTATLSTNRAPALLLAIASVGCATGRLNQFNDLAQAGTAYVRAAQTVIDGAGAAAINADSALLMRARAHLDANERQRRITASNVLLKQRVEVLRLVRAHGELLAEYFEAIGALSDPKATESVAAAAQHAYDAARMLGSSLESARVGSASVSDAVKPAADLFVAAFRRGALDRELQRHAAAIAKEIALEQAAFAVIGSNLETDTLEQQNELMTVLIDQYDGTAALPADWPSRRVALLSRPAVMAALDAAAAAAAKLQRTFAAIVENRSDGAAFAGLMTDVSNLLTVAGSAQRAAQ